MEQTASIIKRLLAAGLTQTALAARTGISQSRLSKWAAGRVPGSVDDALKLKALADELAPAALAQDEVKHAA